MYKIGDFSRLGQVSTRMLRHYDKIGLLTPSQTDEWTSYRYYTIDQLGRLNRIIALKELGFSLGQVSQLLDSNSEPDANQMRRMLTARQSEIEREIRHHQMVMANQGQYRIPTAPNRNRRPTHPLRNHRQARHSPTHCQPAPNPRPHLEYGQPLCDVNDGRYQQQFATPTTPLVEAIRETVAWYRQAELAPAH